MIVYEIGGKLYLNVTNQCNNRCLFCVRDQAEGVGVELWLEREPSAREIIDAVGDAEGYAEAVFCGYGEPLLRLPEVLETARHLKQLGKIVRVNTNGLAGLVWDRPIAEELAEVVDEVSISLNAANAMAYDKLCQPEAGPAAYDALLVFARDCVRHIPRVTLTVVDLISPGEIEACAAIARDIGAGFKVRSYQQD